MKVTIIEGGRKSLLNTRRDGVIGHAPAAVNVPGQEGPVPVGDGQPVERD